MVCEWLTEEPGVFRGLGRITLPFRPEVLPEPSGEPGRQVLALSSRGRVGVVHEWLAEVLGFLHGLGRITLPFRPEILPEPSTTRLLESPSG